MTLICQNCGVEFRPQNRGRNYVAKFCSCKCSVAFNKERRVDWQETKANTSRVTELFAQGFGWVRIAKMTNLSRERVRGLIRKLKLPQPLRKQPPPPRPGVRKIEPIILADYRRERNALATFDESNHWRNHAEAIRSGYRSRAKKQLRQRRNDIEFRLTRTMRLTVRHAVKHDNATKYSRTFALIGCSVGELKSYLESQFDLGMTWANYGSHWHVDHIRPLSSFDLREADQQRQAFHWSNLRPLPAVENLRKHAARHPRLERKAAKRFMDLQRKAHPTQHPTLLDNF